MTSPSISATSSTVRNKDDCLKVLLATDIHLGYGESNQILSELEFILFTSEIYFNFTIFH